MSDWDEMDLDEDELEALRDPDELTPEDVFKMVMVNKIKNTKVKVELQDSEGEKIDLAEVITESLRFIDERMNDKSPEGNQFADQIFPLISQATVSTLGRLLGINTAAFYLQNDTTRMSVIYSMSVAFLLLKYVQKHKLTIHTTEVPVSEDEIEEIERRSEANKAAMIGSMMGVDPASVIRHLFEEGKITEEDLSELLGEASHGNDDSEDN